MTVAARLHNQAIECLNRYQLRAAETQCLRALSVATRHGSSDEQADVISTLAQIRESRWRVGSAERLYRRVLTLVGHRKTRSNLVLLRVAALRGLGRIARVRAQYDDAENLLRHAVGISKQLGRDHVEVGRSLADLGVLYRYTGRLAESTRLYRRALEIIRRALGPRDSDVAGLYHNLAGVEHARGHLARAEADARRSVRIREIAVGRRHPDVAADVALLGAILAERGRVAEAERCITRAIGIFRRTLGDEHFEIAANLGNLGAIRYAQGRDAEAIGLFRKALSTKEKVLGRNHPELVTAINNLSVALRRHGAHREADRLARRAQRLYIAP